MGVVYKARQLKLNRLVALKMVLGDSRVDRDDLARFRTEAEAVACLQHPNIVQIYEVGEEAGRPYFALELVDGGSLAEKLKAGPLSAVQAAELLATLAEAMHFAHGRNIIHRDLKPGNILLMADGTPKITDFGLAKQMDRNQDQTRTGAVLGTPAYMAPEQARGQFKTLGPPADIYALGTILYETLAGRPPFRGETPIETLRQVTTDEPVPLSRIVDRIPRDLETICLKCLEKEPHRRYHTAQDLADDLRRFLAHEPIRARRVRAWERGLKWVRRRPLIATLLAVTVSALASLGTRELVNSQSEKQRQRAARAEVEKMVERAQEAKNRQAWDSARELLASARVRIDEAALDDLRDGVATFSREVDARLESLAAYHRFMSASTDAFFQATLSNGEGSRDKLQATAARARAALAEVGVTVPLQTEWISTWSLDEREQGEIQQGCLKLLLVLADTVAQPLPNQTAEERRRQGKEGLEILDSVARMGLQTQAYHLRRARYLAQAGQDAAAKAERDLGAARPPASALDFYLLGVTAEDWRVPGWARKRPRRLPTPRRQSAWGQRLPNCSTTRRAFSARWSPGWRRTRTGKIGCRRRR
jgi:tRNA A-37 threonylcarbamoyl transferase component Bud32